MYYENHKICTARGSGYGERRTPEEFQTFPSEVLNIYKLVILLWVQSFIIYSDWDEE